MLEDAEVVKLVHRVAVVLGSGDAFDKVCRDVFQQHAVPFSEPLEQRRLKTTEMPEVYERLKIPLEHMWPGEQLHKRISYIYIYYCVYIYILL